MLVLSRHRDESIIIGDDIVITVVDIRGDKVRLGIAAPIEISVHRQEVYEAIQRENRQASRLDPQDARQLENLNPPIRRDVRRPRTRGLRMPTVSGGRDFPRCWHGRDLCDGGRSRPIHPTLHPAGRRRSVSTVDRRPVCFSSSPREIRPRILMDGSTDHSGRSASRGCHEDLDRRG